MLLGIAALASEVDCNTVPENEIPIFIMHGLCGTEQVLVNLTRLIREDFPNRTVVPVYTKEGQQTLSDHGDRLLRYFAQQIKNGAKGAQCADVIGHSQGGFLARAYTQLHSNKNGHPKVRRLISLAGIQGGFYCPEHLLEKQYVCRQLGAKALMNQYSHWAQYFWVPLQYMYDPFWPSKDRKRNNLLYQINQGGAGRDRIIELQYFVMFHSNNDEAMWPQTTSKFGMYDENFREIPLNESQLYKSDVNGLRTLDQRGGIVIQHVDRLWHTGFLYDANFYKDCLRYALLDTFNGTIPEQCK